MKYISKSENDTVEIAKKIGSGLVGGEFIALFGDLGAGKTFFTKALGESLGVEGMIVSPTFTIERIYNIPRKNKELKLHHFDLYRLRGEDIELASEMKELQEDNQNILVVEWPENLKNILPSEYLKIEIKYNGDTERIFEITPIGEQYREVLERL